MAHPPETRQRLRQIYIYDRLSLEAAADKAGVPLGTARRWKAAAEAEGDDWERARSAASLSSAGAGAVAQIVLQDFLTLHQSVTGEVMNLPAESALAKAEAMSRLADAFTKTMNAVAKAAPDLHRFAVASELLQELARFVADRYPQHTIAMAEVLEPFALDVAKRYG
ncbi:DUF1804 family protein [Azospirillum argentinense]|uniref:DUF1804 family protein n=1 Tax=Azospirillum argentinense TaxID=2970906 RepID=A0ABW8VE09_9PROT